MSVDPDKVKAFDQTSLGDILEEAHSRSMEERQVIHGLIDDLNGLIDETDDAAMIVPLIKDYLEINVQNNEQLVKIAQVVQRMYNATIKEDTDNTSTAGLGAEEKEEIRELAQQIGNSEIDEIEKEAEEAAEEL